MSNSQYVTVCWLKGMYRIQGFSRDCALYGVYFRGTILFYYTSSIEGRTRVLPPDHNFLEDPTQPSVYTQTRVSSGSEYNIDDILRDRKSVV